MTQEDFVVVHTAEEICEVSPFGDDSCQAMVNKTVGIGQLTDEISSAAGFPVQAVLFPSSGLLFVHPSVEDVIVRECVDAHIIDPGYGMTDEMITRQRILGKLREGEPLSQEELLDALRIALERP